MQAQNALLGSPTTLHPPSQCFGSLGYIDNGYRLEEVASRLKRHGYRGAICGPAGSGKSTMLQALGDELMGHGLSPLPLHIHNDQKPGLPHAWRRTIPQARHTDVLLLDGYDQLPRWARAWVWSMSLRAGAVVVTSARDVRFKTLARPRPTAALFKQIIDEFSPKASSQIDYESIFNDCGGDLGQAIKVAWKECTALALPMRPNRKKAS